MDLQWIYHPSMPWEKTRQSRFQTVNLGQRYTRLALKNSPFGCMKNKYCIMAMESLTPSLVAAYVLVDLEYPLEKSRPAPAMIHPLGM